MAQYGEVRVDYITYTTGVAPNEGNATAYISGLVNNPTFNGNISVNGNLSVQNILTVSGKSFFEDDVLVDSALTISGDTRIQGDVVFASGIVVSGDSYLQGNLGIGVTSTSGKVHISTTDSTNSPNLLFLENLGTGDDTGSTIYFRNRTGTAFTDCTIQSLGSSTDNSELLFSTEEGAGPVERMRINALGNIGIGTISPGSKLTVQASGTQQSLFSARANNGSGGGMVLQTDASDDGLLRLYDSAGAIKTQLDTDGGDNYIAEGSVGIGVTNPDSGLHVKTPGGEEGLTVAHFQRTTSGYTRVIIDNSSGDGGAIDGISGGGLSFYTRNNNQTGSERMRIVPYTGNVGIGTISPSGLLHLAGSAVSLYFEDTASSNTLSRIYKSGSSLLINSRHTTAGQIVFNSEDSSGTVSERMRINDTGKVGIMNSTPTFLLDVGNTTNALGTTAGDKLDNLRLISDTTNQDRLNFTCRRNADGTNWQTARHRIQRHIDAVFAGYIEFGGFSNDSPELFTFGNSNTELITIDYEGNLGIGTSSPAQLLELSSSGPRLRITDNNTTASTSTSYLEFYGSDARAGIIYTNSNGLNIRADNSGGGDLLFWTGTAEKMRLTETGNLGIGTSSPDAKLEINELSSSSTPAKIKFVNEGERGVTVGFVNHNAAPDFAISSGDQSVHFLSISNNGSASFTSAVTIGGDPSAGNADGVKLFPAGGIRASRTTSTGAVFGGFTTGASGATSQILANGTALFAGTVSAQGSVLTSDQRFKENITDANSQLADITALGKKLRNWDWTADAPVADKDTRFLGLVAQEAEIICPGIVKTIARTKQGAELTPETTDEEGNVTPATYEELDDSYKGISNDVLIMKLLGAVAELSAKVAALEAG
tara:strand:- start:8786 stop:11425 length:2640 start_codon:yes stop_codon:yes gene_type:complete